MSEEKKLFSVGSSKEKIAVDLIWNVLDRKSVLLGLVTEWPGVNVLSIRNPLIPPMTRPLVYYSSALHTSFRTISAA